MLIHFVLPSFGLAKCDEVEKTFIMSRSLEACRKDISQPKFRNHEMKIPGKELDKAFGTWINRLMIVSRGHGADISRRINHSWAYSGFNHDIRLAQRLTDHMTYQHPNERSAVVSGVADRQCPLVRT
jgi:hypothetical protein